MPTLNLRRVGMSHIVERIDQSGLDGRALYDSMAESFGPAVAVMSAEVGEAPIDTLIIDRKPATWDILQAWLEGWVQAQGCQYVHWAEDAQSKGTAATLHFHR